MFSKYKIEIQLIRNQLGTNPCDPNVHSKHVIGKEQKLILDKSQINSQVNKYLGALAIADEKEAGEKEALIARLEALTGIELSAQERADAMAGKLELLKETFKGLETTGVTVFFWNKELERPMIGGHMILGFMKAAAEAIVRATPKGEQKAGTLLKSTAYTCSLINQHMRVEEEFLTFDKDLLRDEAGMPAYLERSLRAKTAQGDRVALAKSEQVESGAKLSFTLKILAGSPLDDEEVLQKMFMYGELCGLGQWRNAGNGQFKVVSLAKA